MKKSYCLSIVPALLLMACMDTTALDQQQAAASAAISAEGQAATNLYLGDMNAADEADAKTMPEGKGKPAGFPGKKPAIDPSVLGDTKEERLAAMAKTVMDRLDTDDSGSISKEEFLSLSKPMDGKGMPKDGEVLESIKAKMEEQFDKFSGGDDLSLSELEASLKARAEAVGQFRTAHFPGKHPERLEKSKEEILAKYDTNKDGKLDEAEFEALRTAEHDAWKEKAEKDGVSMPKKPGFPGAGMPGKPGAPTDDATSVPVKS